MTVYLRLSNLTPLSCLPGLSAFLALKTGTHVSFLFFSREYSMSYKQYYVYILASKKYGTLYTGVTNDLIKRVYEHKESVVQGFTKQYRVNMLVYYEIHEDIYEAITREKRIKRWRRDWKINLIERLNPHWL